MESQNSDKSQTAKKEEEVLKYWRDNKIFEKTLEKESPKGEFVFHDGPPFATGLPHYGSLLPSIVKDLIPRYKTMRGYHVRRRWGWDCHGLPIESMIEKQLGLKSKKDIENIGVEKFNNECRGGVLACADQWQDYIDRTGRWVNFSNSYKTMDNEYMESVWWALGEINKKGLLYEGRKVLMYCPRCETPLAKAEIAMDNSYKEVTDQALTVKFKLKPGQKISNYTTDDSTYILAWTTTPWTLPSNVALAVGKDIVYVKTKSNLILAKDRVGEGEDVGMEFSGSDLLGLEYEPLFDVPAIGNGGKKAYYIISGEFVTTQDGTGVVHIAPIYGEDDYNVGAINDLPMVPLLDQSGHFTDKAPSFLVGQYFKKGNKIVAEELRGKGMIFKEENYTHSYPHCYRCGTALIYNALSSWFINIQKIKKNLIDSNEDINWIPDHLKHGRFLNILENAPDWNISRNRYWASPLPIWKCGGCGEIEMISSAQDIKNKTRSSNKYFVVRHGEAGNNINSIVSSRFENSADYPLTEKGKEQAASAAKLLKKEKIDIIIHSDFERTKNTAEIIAQELGISGENMIADKRLWEAQFGEFEGKKDIEYHAYFQDQEEKFYKNPPGGENLNELKKRVGDFLYEVDKKYNGKNILFVTHDYATWLMFAAASGLNEKQSVALREEADGRGFIKNGEVKELEFAPIPHDPNHALNLHRPYIDEITFGCAKCDGRMKRVSEVLDCWFESGAMPFAEYHYPFENKKEFEERAERALKESFISEYIAQTRTWFYYMHAVAYLVFGKRGFKNVITTGNILAQDGGKMSKSKGNYTDPMENLDKYGADALRYYLMTSVVMQAEDIKFSDQEIKEAHAKIINILRNTFSFFELYKKDDDDKTNFKDSENVLDKWILIRLDELVKEITDNLESYNIVKAGRPIAGFVDDLSTWYLRRSRERFKSEDGEDKQMALATMKFVLLQLAKAIAPFMPFIAEEIYRGAGGEKESVHLEDWPTRAEAVASPTEIIDSMEEVRNVASLGLEARAKVGIKVRQSLASLKVKSEKLKAKEEFLDLIKDELNVKEVVFDGNISGEVELDTEITLELREEGELREFLRALQDMRKKAGLTPEQKIVLQIETGESGKKFLEKFSGEIGRAVGAEKVEFTQDQTDALEVKLEDKAFKVKIG